MAYIKSHSNYVLRKKHQLTNDGTVWERDMSTVGVVDSFVNGETPTYQSGNFVITRNPGKSGTIQGKPSNWSKNDDGEVWTLKNVSALTSLDEFEDDTRIIIKKDCFDFRDFAYYGSLSELFRASLNDIAQRFPGELYSYSADVYYTERKTVRDENTLDAKKLGSGYLLSNPYGIDLHTKNLPQGANADKYFADGGYSGYSIIKANGTETPITSWTPTYKLDCPEIGKCFATIKINSTTVSAFTGDEGIVYYFVSTRTGNIHIRPSEKRLNKFYNECNDLERVILNPDTTPRYKATFSVIKENEFGYYRELEDFIFPTLEGDYNLDITSFGFNRYTSRLAEIGEYYDEYFSDNLYRSMTHESIKNFDWTFSRYEDENEEVIKGADRIKKIIRLFAREFDEVKSYIDAMTSLNRITYDDRSNIPNYFLTDSLEDDGWDVKKVCPYSANVSAWCDLIDSEKEKKFVQDYSNTFTPYSNKNVKDGLENGYFIVCSCDTRTAITSVSGYTTGRSIKAVTADIGEASTPDCKNGGYLERIRSHFNDKEYSMFELDNEFLKRLKINSRAILRHKGTIEGVEMILGLFGLKSRQYSPDDYDYYIEEYYLHTDGLSESAATYQIENKTLEDINERKLINYPNREGDNLLRGLMLIHDEDNKKYYPYYDEDAARDGDVYYQMGGGWMSNVLSGDVGGCVEGGVECEVSGSTYGDSGTVGFRVNRTPSASGCTTGCTMEKIGNEYYNFQFDVDNNVVYNEEYDECRLYKETIRTVRKVRDLDELLSIPKATLNLYAANSPDRSGIIYYVENVTGKIGLIRGNVYPIHSETLGNKTYNYVKFVKQDGFVQAGHDKFFDEIIDVYDREGHEQHVYLRDKEDGYVIKAYVNSDNKILCGTMSDECGVMVDLESSPNATNYFILRDVNYSDKLKVGDTDGWERLTTNDNDYKKINTIYNYVKGNNPHGSTFGYDMGRGYLDYIRRPFKYAVENDLFDDRCFIDYNEMKTFLTDNVVMPISGWNDDKIGYTDALIKSDKIDDATSASYKSLEHINTKRVKIGFVLKSPSFNAAELKYLDDIVSNYMMQMIPSTSIVEVVYECGTSAIINA